MGGGVGIVRQNQLYDFVFAVPPTKYNVFIKIVKLTRFKKEFLLLLSETCQLYDFDKNVVFIGRNCKNKIVKLILPYDLRVVGSCWPETVLEVASPTANT